MRNEPMTLDTAPPPLATLFTRPELQRFAAGLVLFEEGELPAGVFIVHSGDVVLSALLDGQVTRLRAAHAGEILGLMAVISGRAHLSSAVAVTMCEVGFIESGEFRRLVDESPAVWFSVLHQLSQDVTASYDVIRERAASPRDVRHPAS